MVLMKRTNRFNIEWDDPEEAEGLAIGCSTLWNKLNYKRRGSFFDEDEEFDWSSEELYDEFKGCVEQVVNVLNVVQREKSGEVGYSSAKSVA
ncbi:MAG: hypothetical protein R6W73_00330 [Candidatus Saliniplasma sp.]